jgi:hypothetical protein
MPQILPSKKKWGKRHHYVVISAPMNEQSETKSVFYHIARMHLQSDRPA